MFILLKTENESYATWIVNDNNGGQDGGKIFLNHP
jgi:hypothetical protein